MPLVEGRYVIYTIQPNDTLESIANQLGSNVQGISQINGLFPPFIEPGMVQPGHWLIAPVPMNGPGQSQVIYIIQPGDTLDSVASDFSISVNNIMNVNPQLTNEGTLQPFQGIEIPVNIYALSTGESLYNVSQQLGVSPQTIINMNQRRPRMDPAMMPPGYGWIVP